MNTCVLLCACTPVNSCHIVESMHCMTYRLSRWVRDVMNEMLGLLFCQMFSRCYSIVLLLYTSISYVCRCRDILVSSLFSCCICSISIICVQMPRYTCISVLCFIYLFTHVLTNNTYKSNCIWYIPKTGNGRQNSFLSYWWLIDNIVHWMK